MKWQPGGLSISRPTSSTAQSCSFSTRLVVIVQLDRRDLVWINVTANPTAEWVARQITEAFPWDETQHYLIRDRCR